MNRSRHAGRPPSPLTLTVFRAAIIAISTALAASVGLLGGMILMLARRVVTPAVRIPDTRILRVNTKAQTITLARTADTILPGRYGLITDGTTPYVKLGSILSSDDTSVTRKLLTQLSTDSDLAAEAVFSGWYYNLPRQLHLPYSDEVVSTPVGACPAWLFPASTPTDLWVIQIHGRGSERAECLRAVPIFHAAGITSLVVSYRNDGDAPRSRAGSYGLGTTEWEDVDAALAFAHARGARRIILMGWSMGGAIALQTALLSSRRTEIVGLILESPVIDWRSVLDFQAKLARVPTPVSDLAMGALGREWAPRVLGADGPIKLDELDLVARAQELSRPVLVLHSDDDGFVPSGASHELKDARPDIVDLEVFSVARHTKLWNYDPERFSNAITTWLDRHGFTTGASRVG